MQTTTIVIADDHPLFRDALRQAVATLMPNARVLEADGLEQLHDCLAKEKDVDLILLDLTMPGVQGFSGLVALRAQYPQFPVIIVSAREESTIIRRAMDFGASGFIPKSLSVATISSAIQTVLAGDTWTPPDIDLGETEDRETAELVRRIENLTPQQLRVLMMLAEGLLNKQIAHELNVSEATVKAHVSAILDKLGVDSRTQAVIAAGKIGLTQHSPAGNSEH